MRISEFKSSRLLMRCIESDEPILEYLEWMSTPSSNPFIVSAREDFTLEELRHYLDKVNGSGSELQLGLFLLESGKHIGNIKFQRSSKSKGVWEVGFLIGDANERGKGYAREALEESVVQLRSRENVIELTLGVDPSNEHAIHSYFSMGFRSVEGGSQSGPIRMVKRLDSGGPQ